jgi:hypothetical protein
MATTSEPEELQEEEDEPIVLGACIEKAKSGRSLCKECKGVIAKEELRIGGAVA